MPKKLSTNQKSVDARLRKDVVKQAEKARVQQAKDDEFWRDDDKQVAKKQARKEEKERKEAEERERKKEREKLLEEEMSQLKGKETTKVSQKVTRAQIGKTLAAMSTPASKDDKIVKQDFIVENPNTMEAVDGSARTMDEAISLLASINMSEAALDRHPERRLKATWEAFESARLPALKAENPNMRLSQIRQMIRREWQRSPENPLNQRALAYNARTSGKCQNE